MANLSAPLLPSNASAPGVHVYTNNIVGIVVCLWIIVSHSAILACYGINRSQPWTTYSKQIFSLSLNDLLVGVVGLILLIIRSMGEDIIPYGVCAAGFFFYLSTLCTNLYHVFAICIYRAILLVNKPTKAAPTGTKINALLFLIGWIPSFVLCAIVFVLWVEDRDDIRVCLVNRVFGYQLESALAVIAISYLIPLICTNIVYGVTLYKLVARWKRTFPIQTDSTATTSQQSSSKAPGKSQGHTPDQALGQAPGQASDQTPGKCPGHTAGQSPRQSPEQALVLAPGQAPGKAQCHAAEEAPGQTPGQAHDRAPEEPPGQSLVSDPEQAPGQAPGHAAEEALGHAPGKSLGHPSEQAPDLAPGQASGQTPGHSPCQAPGQEQGHDSGQASGQASGNTQGHASGQANGQEPRQTPGPALTTTASNANRPGMLAQKRATLTIGLLLLFFNLFSLPLIIVMIVLVSGGNVDQNIRFSLSNMFAMNSVASPFVYALRVKNLGQTLKKCIPCYSRQIHVQP